MQERVLKQSMEREIIIWTCLIFLRQWRRDKDIAGKAKEIILSHIFTRMEEMVVPVGEIAGRLSKWRKKPPAGWRCQCNHHYVHNPVHTWFLAMCTKTYSRTPIFSSCQDGSMETLRFSKGPSVLELCDIRTIMDHVKL